MATAEEMKAAFWEKIKEDPYNAHWHYMFADWLEENGFDDEAELQRQWTVEKQKAAEEFMDMYADEISGGHYHDDNWEEHWQEISRDNLIQFAHNYLDSERYFTLSFDTPEIVHFKQKEFWHHFMVLTGRPVPSDKREEQFIGCSC